MNISVAAGTLIAGFFDNTALFCRSIDLIENLDKGKETPFCNITGEHTSVVSLEGTFSHTQAYIQTAFEIQVHISAYNYMHLYFESCKERGPHRKSVIHG